MTQVELANKLCITASTISYWINDKRVPCKDNLLKMAKIFNVDPNFLFGIELNNNNSEYNSCSIPLIENIKDDFYGNHDFDISLPIVCLDPDCAYFAMYIKDNSMLGSGIKDGDIVIFERTHKIKNGQIGLFMIKNILYCRRYFNNRKIVVLKSSNDTFLDIELHTNEFECVGILKCNIAFY